MHLYSIKMGSHLIVSKAFKAMKKKTKRDLNQVQNKSENKTHCVKRRLKMNY